jgi:hypothetical protein
VTLPMSASTACSSRLSKSKIYPGLNNRRWRSCAGGFFFGPRKRAYARPLSRVWHAAGRTRDRGCRSSKECETLTERAYIPDPASCGYVSARREDAAIGTLSRSFALLRAPITAPSRSPCRSGLKRRVACRGGES